jgi:hypothetical protein
LALHNDLLRAEAHRALAFCGAGVSVTVRFAC